MARVRSTTVLLVAGLGDGGHVWREVAPVLAERYDVITVDNAARSTIGELAADAASVLDGPAHVVGISMGGYVALTLALARPELVQSLVLIATGAGGPGHEWRSREVSVAFAEAYGLPPEEYTRRTLPYTLAPGWPESNPERYEAMVAAQLEHPTSPETIAAHAQACFRFYDEGREVEGIPVPALVVHGELDLIVPVGNGRRLARRLPHAEYVELPGRGHDLVREAPKEVAALIAGFLDGLA